MSTGSSRGLAAEELALLLSLKDGLKGRYSISRETGLGEGVIRRLYRRLADEGLIRVTRGGAAITGRGLRLLQGALEGAGVSGIDVLPDGLVWGPGNITLVAWLEWRVPSIIEARDAAVRRGAAAVLVVRRAGGGFYIPYVEGYDVERNMPALYSALVRSGGPEDGDVVAIVAGTLVECLRGLAAILALRKNTRIANLDPG